MTMNEATNSPSQTAASAGESQKIYPFGLKTIMELFDVGPGIAITALTGALLVILLSIAYFIHSAPPSEITISTGPEGSVSERNALKYADILKKDGVTLKILRSQGSFENLERLADPNSRVDVGFVQGGVTTDKSDNLVSLGSMTYQPVLVFYRGKPIEFLSGLAGKKIVIGPAGSGVRNVALALLSANGIKEGGPTTLLDWESDQASKALLDGQIDAAFVMGESASMPVLRSLIRSSDVHLYDFKQANAYSRKINYLNVLELPQGAIDLGSNLPPQDVMLVGPTVELIAKKTLHPALSDLLLEAAIETHGKPGIFQKRGEFPAPQEHDIRISDDAKRFYTSGKSLLYRYLPFWLASLVSRLLVAFVPTLVVLIPVMKSIPAFFRWRAHMKIRRHYSELLNLERRWLRESDATERDRIRREFDRIEEKVNRSKIRPAFADQFYGLRGHISYVRALVSRE
jgi:TRAP-type uncharacterized transport system substrate-binding protein